MINLDDVEALAEQLVEGTFGRLFHLPLHPAELVRRLARAMEDQQLRNGAGQLLLPNRYWILLNPADFAALNSADETVYRELSECMNRLAAREGGRFSGRLLITLEAVADLNGGQVEVRAGHVSEPGQGRDTRQVTALVPPTADPRGWMLHCDGRVFALGEPVVRLGRALSNDVILDNARVSRQHAQLRWRQGSYHLSDLGSTHGVALNGQILRPGDEVPVADGDHISLAGLVLIVTRQPEQPRR